MKYGYARVSSLGQDLDTQIQILKDENYDEIFSEKITSNVSKKVKRMQLEKLLLKLQAGDTLVVTRLDRLARSTQQALTLIQELFEREVNIHILNIGRIENTPTGRLIFTVFSAFAEFERELIVERMHEGKQLAKLDPNFKEGRPKKYTKNQRNHAVNLLKQYSYKQVEDMTGISKTTLWRYKKESTSKHG